MNKISEYNGNNGSELVMNIVVKSLRGIYPSFRSTVKSQVELDNMKKEWLQAFIDHNIKTDIQINRGLKEARNDKSPFMPSVGLFISWCKSPHPSHVEFDKKALEYNSEKSAPEFVKEMIAKCKRGL